MAVSARRVNLLETLSADIVAAGGKKPVIIESDLYAGDAAQKLTDAALSTSPARASPSTLTVRFGGVESPNLFAAGEIMAGNILGQDYTAVVGMMIGTVFGRIASVEYARAAIKNVAYVLPVRTGQTQVPARFSTSSTRTLELP